jgi:hypothetical protein
VSSGMTLVAMKGAISDYAVWPVGERVA